MTKNLPVSNAVVEFSLYWCKTGCAEESCINENSDKEKLDPTRLLVK